MTTEVVLAVVLSAFRVSMPQKEIVWNLGFIVQPSVEGSLLRVDYIFFRERIKFMLKQSGRVS